MAILTREQILASKRAREVVSVPEWGGDVIVADMGGTKRDEFERWCLDNKGSNFVGVRATLASYTIIDEEGARLFTPDDVAALGELSAAALQRVYDVATRLNRLSNADAEELEKNSGAAPSGNSTST